MNELQDLLRLATDRVESPRLEHDALRIARRRRTRRRSAAAAVAASALVLAVIAGTQDVGLDGSPQPAAPTTTVPHPTPTATTEDDLEDSTAVRAEDVVDDPSSQLVDLATSSSDPDVRVAVWRACLDDTCGSIAVAMALTTDGFDTRAVPDQVWRTIPLVAIAPAGDVLVTSWSSRMSSEIVRPDGSVSRVSRTATSSAVAPGELVGGVLYGRNNKYYATDTATAVAHSVPVPEGTTQLHQTPTGQLRVTTLDGTYAWSDDGGATWQQAAGATSDTKIQLLADSTPAVHVLLGGSDGATLFPFEEVRVLEDPDSWSVIAQPASERAYLGGAAALPDGRLLLDVEDWSSDQPGGLYVSSGKNWASYSRVPNGAPFDGKPTDIRVVDMRVDQDAVTILAVGPSGTDAWLSQDAGVSWASLTAR